MRRVEVSEGVIMTESGRPNGSAVLRFQGRLVLANLPGLRAKLESMSHGSPTLCLDLSAVEDLDMSAVSWLMQADQRLRRRGGRLRIVAASKPVRHAMRLLGPATARLTSPC